MNLLASLFLASAFALSPAQPWGMNFKTKDGWEIAALYHSSLKSKPMVILVHGVAAGKGEWQKLCAALWKMGYGTLAIDLRGHGESVMKGKTKSTFQDFDRTGEWPRAEEDIHAAIRFLEGRGVAPSRIGLVGGSIGANLVSQAAAKEKIRWVILLSPGENYRGVGIADLSGRKAVVAASPGDAYAHQTSVSLAMQPNGPVFLEAKQGHGAQLIDDPEFLAKLLDWIKKN